MKTLKLVEHLAFKQNFVMRFQCQNFYLRGYTLRMSIGEGLLKALFTT